MTIKAIACRGCREYLPPNAFTPSELRVKRPTCRECVKKRLAHSRGLDDVAVRTLYNFQTACRANKIEERSVWTLADVQRLIDDWRAAAVATAADPGTTEPRRFRIKRVDASIPFLPNNAVIVPSSSSASSS